MSNNNNNNNDNDKKDDSPSYSSLAALSARHSLKRARVLYAVNPLLAFVPSTDPTIFQDSINRRRRRHTASFIEQQQKDGSNRTSRSSCDTLVIATDDNINNNNTHTTLRMKPVVSDGSNVSSALSISNGASNTKANKTAGILVVRCVIRRCVASDVCSCMV
jgi:hypothetical protein